MNYASRGQICQELSRVARGVTFSEKNKNKIKRRFKRTTTESLWRMQGKICPAVFCQTTITLTRSDIALVRSDNILVRVQQLLRRKLKQTEFTITQHLVSGSSVRARGLVWFSHNTFFVLIEFLCYRAAAVRVGFDRRTPPDRTIAPHRNLVFRYPTRPWCVLVNQGPRGVFAGRGLGFPLF